MRSEREQNTEIEREALNRYVQSFIPRFDCYPLQKPDGSYTAIHEPLTSKVVEAHLIGTATIGAYALDTNNRARWLCLDADDEQDWHGLWRLAHHLKHEAVPAYVEPSRRGGHLWMFFDPLPATDIRRFGKWLLSEHQLETVELYPKQDELRTGTGSLVRLPLGIHRKDGQRYYFIDLNGKPLAPSIREQMHVLGSPEKIPYPYIQGIVNNLPEPRKLFPTPHFEKFKGLQGATPSERIRAAISVYDFVSQYVDLDRNGHGYCPFHDDHLMSFGVNNANNFWHCFAGCGGGSVIDFWMKWRESNGANPDFTESITELAQILL
jgi:hypothetical protein